METVLQQISQHHVELFFCGALGDVRDNVVAFVAHRPESGNLVRSDPECVCNQGREPCSAVGDAVRVRRADATRGGEHRDSAVDGWNLDASDRGDFEFQLRLRRWCWRR